MSSSISSSDATRPWRRFAALLVLCTAGLIAGIVGVAYAIDPYDSGRSTLFQKRGVRVQGPRTAAASRGRDPAFDAAIVGNSHVQLLSPERLLTKTVAQCSGRMVPNCPVLDFLDARRPKHVP